MFVYIQTNIFSLVLLEFSFLESYDTTVLLVIGSLHVNIVVSSLLQPGLDIIPEHIVQELHLLQRDDVRLETQYLLLNPLPPHLPAQLLRVSSVEVLVSLSEDWSQDVVAHDPEHCVSISDLCLS